jgi:dimethylamine monooxygenase subunit A
VDWFAELDLEPGSTWLRMGTRPLGTRPWLMVEDRRSEDLGLKGRLLDTSGAEVFHAGPETQEASAEVLDLVVAATGSAPDRDRHPLDAAGRLVREDLCLLQRRDGSWHLDAASLCFPSGWSLRSKVGRPMVEVHGAVEGYEATLAAKVDLLFDRLTTRPVWRRNWFVYADPALHQPRRVVAVDGVVPAARCRSSLWLRSERQTLRRLPSSGWVLFTIGIQQASIGEVAASPSRARALARYLDQASVGDLEHRHLSAPQARELRAALTAALLDHSPGSGGDPTRS